MYSKKIDRTVIVFVIILFSIIFFNIFIDNFLDLPYIGINDSDISNYNTEWSFKYNNETKSNITLPRKENVELMQEYQYINTFPKDISKGNVLTFRAIMQNVKIEVDGEIVLDLNNNKAVTNKSTLGTYWVFYEIPNEFLGKEFKIILNSNYDFYSGYLSEVFLLYKGQQKSFLFNNDYRSLVYLIAIIIIVIYLILTGVIMIKNKNDYSIFCFSIFMLNFIVWLMSESGMILLFTDKTYILTRTQYNMMNLLQLTMVMWLDFHVNHSYRKYTNILKNLIFINVIVLFLLSFYNIIENKLFLKFIHLTILFEVIVYSYIYYKEYKRNVIQNIKSKILVVILVFVFAIVELILYYKDDNMDIELFSRTGLFCTAIVFFINYYISYKSSERLRSEKDYLSKIAYRDNMTNAYNRAAFNLDVDRQINEYIIISFDCNSLKEVNDTLGHIYGDEVIINTYICIEKSFGKYGKTYRMGGDEFITIIENININIENCKKEFYNEVKNVNDKVKYDFSISMGIYSAYNNMPIEEAMKISDKLMYIDKQSMKNR